MAATTIQTYSQFVPGLTSGMFDWKNETWKLALLNGTYTPNPSDTSFDAIAGSELPTASGYKQGGYTISKSYYGAGTTSKVTLSNVSVVAQGGTLVAKTAVIYKVGYAGGVSNPLIASIPLSSTGASVTIEDGKGLTLTFNTQTGAFILTAP